MVDSVFDLTPEALRAAGIVLVLADLDNTLASYEEARPSQAVRAWKGGLEEAGIGLFLVSNSRKSHRAPDFCAALGIPCIRHAGKPRRGGFFRALEQAGARPDQAVMVGDQIFTDILGANRAGIASVLVHPIAWGDNPLRRLRYAVETPFRLLGRRKG